MAPANRITLLTLAFLALAAASAQGAASNQEALEACSKRRALKPNEPDPMCDILEKGGTPTPEQLKALMPAAGPGEDFKAMEQATGGTLPLLPAAAGDAAAPPLPAGSELPGQPPTPPTPQSGGPPPSSGGGSQGGSIATPIQSMSTQFKAFSGAAAMRQKMMKPKPAVVPQASAPAAPAPIKTAAVPAPAPKPAPAQPAPKQQEALPPPPPPPSYENVLLYSFLAASPLLRDLEPDEPRAEPRPIGDIPLPPPRPIEALAAAVRADTSPAFKFNLYPIEHDPFNLGLPRAGAEPLEAPGLLEKLKALLRRGQAAPAGRAFRYLALSPPENEKARELSASGVPLALFWSGRVRQQPLAQAAVGTDAAAALSAPAVLDGEAAAWAARAWGLR